ncbi:hypothetical protein, partial [Amorphus sp. MBR-141]
VTLPWRRVGTSAGPNRRTLTLRPGHLDGAGQKGNDHLLADLMDNFGLACTQVSLRASLNQLEQLGLVVLMEREKLIVAELTADGRNAAIGTFVPEGVLRPRPDCPY